MNTALLSTVLPAIHGMLMLGTQSIYLSHLPMFHSPHDYQAIFEVSLSAADASPRAVYLNDRQTSGERLYTLEPERRFTMTDIAHAGATFPATIYRGHFERGGIPIFRGATVTIRRVVYFHQFDPSDAPPEESRYLLFGNGSESFIAHRIVACPDYDQVEVVQSVPPPSESAAAIPLSISGRYNSLPLAAGESVTAITTAASFHLHVDEQIYLETGDLVCMGQPAH